ncbi:MAG: hypothetical protein HY305_01420, partial [Sphingobacteriales bacterium]|nr:hypothetical protein [Sphingobacteriales bacterium]
ANTSLSAGRANIGLGLSTSYNSRIGLKSLTLTSELNTNYDFKYKVDADEDMSSGNTRTMSRSHSLVGSTTINFAKPSYIPFIRMPMTNLNITSQMEFGMGLYGVRGSLSGMGYYMESIVAKESRLVTKPMVGYMYAENANDDENAIMDFNRHNDAEVTPNTPVISAPQYNYDVFSVQGEGTGSNIRAYRGDMGTVRDNVTASKDQNFSLGVDLALISHYGTNFNVVSTPSKSGGWNDNQNKLNYTMKFGKPNADNKSSFENIYFRTPGETTVTNDEVADNIGRDNLVRFQLSPTGNSATLESRLYQFNKKTLEQITIPTETVSLIGKTKRPEREKRTQVTTMLTAHDAGKVGLEKEIRSYTGTLDENSQLVYEPISREFDFRKKHHISEINVLEKNGMRYVYGLPVYNIVQKDFTFSVKNPPNENNIATFEPEEPTVNSEHVKTFATLHGFVQTQQVPAYASSFLLTGLLSPDYVDVTDNGITEDDLGSAVKFDYAKSQDRHRWRTPRNNSSLTEPKTANFVEGIRTERNDNKANISYGEREVWYLNAIESKSMIAIFTTEDRDDGKGVIADNVGLNGNVNENEQANKRLKKIDLYTKAELRQKGLVNAKPIKTVFFKYSYSLCKGTPDNKNGEGKLTLDSVCFVYNKKEKKNKDKYVFSYGDKDVNKNYTAADNPCYGYNASDRWGTYKNKAINPSGLSNADYPFTANVLNDQANKIKNDQFASAWSLKKILLPSGALMKVDYEADDYGYVQDRRACEMYAIAGIGNTDEYKGDDGLYSESLFGEEDNHYVYIKLPQPLEGNTTDKQRQEIKAKYLEGLPTDADGRINQLSFKLQVMMPKGIEPLTCYAQYDVLYLQIHLSA